MANHNTVKSLNKDTGELNDLYLQFCENIPKDGSMRFAGTIRNDTSFKDIKIYPIPTKEEKSLISEDPFWGDMINMGNDRHHFAKVFTNLRVDFSSDTFYKYWYEIIIRLRYNCNVIINKKPRIHPIQNVEEFQEILGAKLATTYKFLQECKDKGYLAKIEFSKQVFWVANPFYTRSGNTQPILLLDLFQFGKDYLENNLEEKPISDQTRSECYDTNQEEE